MEVSSTLFSIQVFKETGKYIVEFGCYPNQIINLFIPTVHILSTYIYIYKPIFERKDLMVIFLIVEIRI